MELSTHPAESHHPNAPSGGAACGLEEEYSFVTLQVKHADSCSLSPSLAITKTRLGEDWPDPCWEAVGEGPPYPLHRVKTGTVSTKMNMDLLADPALLLFFARNLICVCACRYVRVWFYLHIRTCVCVCVCAHVHKWKPQLSSLRSRPSSLFETRSLSFAWSSLIPPVQLGWLAVEPQEECHAQL